MNDKEIMDLFFERSERAVDALSGKYGPLFRKIAADILGVCPDAEETVNDLYLALWNNIPPARPENLKSYAVRILRNLAIKRYHANTAQKRNSHYDVALEEIADYLPGGQSPEELLEARELGSLINRFLAGLEKQDRIFFVRRYYLAETPAAIGRAVGKSAHYVSVRLHRVRKDLKEYLIREGIAV